MQRATNSKKPYTKFTPEEEKWIAKNYSSCKSVKDFYRNYVRKFGKKRSLDSLMGKVSRMSVSMVDSSYYQLTEIAKLFKMNRSVVREHMGVIGVKPVKIRGILYISDTDIDKVFKALEKKESESVPKGWLPIAKASDILGVSKKTISWAVYKGYLHPKQVHLRFYFDPRELDRIVDLLKKTESPQILWSKWCRDVVYLSKRG